MTAISLGSVTQRARSGGWAHGLWVPATIDAVFLVVLSSLGLLGFRSVYGGSTYLLVGILGVALGVTITELARRLGQPVLAEAVLAVLAFFLLGGAATTSGGPLAGVVPTAHSISALGHAGIYGWKELLTTSPPVGSSSNLLAIPYIVGLIAGVAGQSLARRTRAVAWPVVAPGLVLMLGILFGAKHPASVLLQGSLFTALALAWVSMRYHRGRALIGTRRALGRNRILLAGTVLALAGVGAEVVGPNLPGASAHSRVVLSRYVVPPFEANQQPSPLASFRKYVKKSSLYDQTLFTVTGLQTGSAVRIATMDSYDQIAWGFGGGPSVKDAFKRYGSDLPAGPSGQPGSVTVKIGAIGGVWLPTVGSITHISFAGPDASVLSKSFRYDTGTGTAAVPSGLKAGDSYTMQVDIPSVPSSSALTSAGAGSDVIDVGSPPSVLQADANTWAGDASGAWGRVSNIANYMLAHGFYSDGTESPPLSMPGHNAGRLVTLLVGGGVVGDQMVGNDEQYASALALMADSVGVPARVVLGARVEPGGVVMGKDVHAWVEVSLAGLGWVPLYPEQFLPTLPPQKSPPKNQADAPESAPVQPPVESALHAPLLGPLPGSVGTAVSHFGHAPRAVYKLPAWLVTLAWWVLPIATAALLVVVMITGLKARRRRKRRTAGTPAMQIAGAWSELLDLSRDLGGVIPSCRTRREQAPFVRSSQAAALALRGDASVFGPDDPTADEAGAYWAAVERIAAEMRSTRSRLGRLQVAMSLRSLRPSLGGGLEA